METIHENLPDNLFCDGIRLQLHEELTNCLRWKKKPDQPHSSAL